MSNPEYVKVDNELYKINTDFRIALECNDIANNEDISDYERALAIIYKLFGEKGLDCDNQNKLLEKAIRYLVLDRPQNSLKINPRSKYELDFKKCKGLIKSSFKFDYNYNPYDLEYLHWYDFYNDLENLSTSEFGNCCILNRVQSILNTDVSTIKDAKERKKYNEAIQILKEKYCISTEKELTKEEEESSKQFYKSLGIEL